MLFNKDSPPEELLGKRFCPGENRAGGDPLHSPLRSPVGGWNAEGNDLLIVLMASVAEAVVDDADDAAASGRNAPAAATEWNGMKWWEKGSWPMWDSRGRPAAALAARPRLAANGLSFMSA